MSKKIVSTDKAPKAIGPYSQAVEANGMLFLSGQLALDPATGKLVEGGIGEQTDQVMRNIRSILEASGYSLQDVVKSVCLLSDMGNFTAMNEIYGIYYPTNPPARVTYAVAALPLGALIEIETIAMK